MIKVAIVLYRNQMTLEQQHKWWIEEHAPIAREMPGLRSYVINLSDKDEDGAEPAIAGTDELLFDDYESALAAWNSPEWQAAREHTQASGARAMRTWIAETHEIVASPDLTGR